MAFSRFGQANQAGDVKALFHTQFLAEVLTAFDETNVFMSRHRIRNITAGKSATFQVTGKGGTQYVTPGTLLTGTGINHNERLIAIDDLLVADRMIFDLDEAMADYDVRSVYSRDIGMSLSRDLDRNVARIGVIAARSSAAVTDGNGGTIITAATAKTSAAVLIQSILDALQAMDEKDVPEEDRSVYIKPAQYSLLIGSGNDAINEDYGNAGNGSIASGKIYRIGGAEIVKTNNLPSAEVATGPTTYQGVFTNTAALVMQREAVGTVKLLDVSVQSDWLIQLQGELIVGRLAVGHGVLRPECAAEIRTAVQPAPA